MEIVNSKEIGRFVWIVSLITLISIIFPLTFYFINFHGSLSDDHTKWGTFGDYIGGIIGTLFNLVAVIFSVISIYITLKIATRIHDNEQKFNQENIIRETERFEKEIELTHKQNKPFPHPHLTKFAEETKIMLCNYGTGPMIIKELHFSYKDNIYSDFAELFVDKIPRPSNLKSIDFLINNDNKHIIPPGGEKILLQIRPTTVDLEDFHNYQNACRDVLKYVEMHFKFEDIFENTGEQTYNFEFFSPIPRSTKTDQAELPNDSVE